MPPYREDSRVICSICYLNHKPCLKTTSILCPTEMQVCRPGSSSKQYLLPLSEVPTFLSFPLSLRTWGCALSLGWFCSILPASSNVAQQMTCGIPCSHYLNSRKTSSRTSAIQLFPRDAKNSPSLATGLPSINSGLLSFL